ncbi:MAG: PfkB family carbohydrate kinase [Sedimenticola sp.]
MTLHNKTLSLEQLADAAGEARKEGRTVGLCHGTFDLLHIGHIRHLKQASSQVDVLFVTVTSDRYVNKGPDRPVFEDHLRAEHISALEFIDAVSVNEAETAVNVLHAVRPDIYFKGEEYSNDADDVTGNIEHERRAVEEGGGRIVFTGGITYSSSNLLNSSFKLFPAEVENYLETIRKTYKPDAILDVLESLSDLRVLVVGDAIIDEYHYVEVLGQSGKNNMLAAQFRKQERFAGGSVAVANHIAEFADQVTLLSCLGEARSDEDFIKSKLARNIAAQFFYQADTMTLCKRRFVSGKEKLFEVYIGGDQPIDKALDSKIRDWLIANARDFDVVVVPDYGNGFISPAMIEALCSKANILSVNTQINSGNRGYHFITRYPNADFVALNEPELRMALHDRTTGLEALANKARDQLSAKWLAVTRGEKGVLFVDAEGNTVEVPALSTKVVDRIGAGDAFLSVASICYAKQVAPPLAMLIAAAAAALDVQIVCNRSPVQKSALAKYLTSLLK